MSEVWRCDNCMIIGGPFVWFHVERGGEIHYSDEPEDGWHFCSMPCLAEWAKLKAESLGSR